MPHSFHFHVAHPSKGAIDFRLPDAVQHSVSGRVSFLATGKPAVNAAIRVDPAYPYYGTSASVHSGADGTFHLEGLTDGHYRMEGMLRGDGDLAVGGRIVRFFEVKAADVANLNIQVGGTRVKGNLKAIEGSLPERMNVQLVSRSPFGGTGDREARGSVRFGADGAFEFADVQPGVYDVKVIGNTAKDGPKPEFFVGSVTVDGHDVSDSGITVAEGTAPVNLFVTVDFGPGTISGKTLDSQNRPLPGANLVLMSADPQKRLLDPYWRQIKSDRDGAFRMGSLIPGDYLLLMWPGYHPWDGLDTEAFAILEKQAIRVRVERGGSVSDNLKLTEEVGNMLDALLP